MKQTIFLGGKVLWCVAIVVLISACSSSDEILDGASVPMDGDISEVLKEVNTEWGTSKDAICQYMEGYQSVESADENILQFKAKKLPVTIGYQFYSGKLCRAVMVAKKNDGNNDVKKLLEGYNYVGTSGNNSIYANEDNNVFAVSYDSIDSENVYQIAGFTILYPKTEKINGIECTDLGSSVKWATCNVGANSQEESGGYFAWGETEEKDTYTWSTYKHCEGSKSTCKSIGENISGTQYDVCTTVLGSPWSLPTKEEMTELVKIKDWIFTEEKGVKGCRVFGENGNYIFLPAAGGKSEELYSFGKFGEYATATLDSDATQACELSFASFMSITFSIIRCNGISARAVIR